MQKSFASLPLALLVLAVPEVARAADLLVPTQYPTIGAAVTAATNGDSIVVADGTYTAPANFNILLNKSITLKSVNGSAKTILQPTSSSILTIQGRSTIQGFTIDGSSAHQAAFSAQATTTFEDCVFRNIDVSGNFSGAAINTQGGTGVTVTVNQCTFTGNTGLAAIQANSVLSVSNSTFSSNHGYFGSGAIYANTAAVTISGTTFTNNTSAASNPGGAIYFVNGSLAVSDSSFIGNSSGAGGGAIAFGAQGIDSPMTLTRVLFRDNTAPSGGVIFAGISSNHATEITVVDSLFIGNTATADGAVYTAASTAAPVKVSFTNASFFGNETQAASGGVLVGNSQTTLAVKNSILFGDVAATEISTAHPFAAQSVTSSDVHQVGFAGSNGNIDADPMYIDAAASDLHIAGSSPCAGAGTSDGAPANDYVQSAWGTQVSIGAFAPAVARFVLDTPPTTTSGTGFPYRVSARDVLGSEVRTYVGTVHFTSSDPGATLPADTLLNGGSGTFSAKLVTAGAQTITATDTVVATTTGTSPDISVVAAQSDADASDGTQDGSVDATPTEEDAGPSSEVASATGTGGSPNDSGCGCSAIGRADAELVGGPGMPLAVGLAALFARRRTRARRTSSHRNDKS